VRMLNSSGELHLALESLDVHARGQIGWEHLHHHAPVERTFLREKDVTHASTAELALEGVRPAEGRLDLLPKIRGHAERECRTGSASCHPRPASRCKLLPAAGCRLQLPATATCSATGASPAAEREAATGRREPKQVAATGCRQPVATGGRQHPVGVRPNGNTFPFAPLYLP